MLRMFGNKLRVVSAVAVGALAGLTGIRIKCWFLSDDLATISTNLGITAEELQYLNYIAIQTDVKKNCPPRGGLL